MRNNMENLVGRKVKLKNKIKKFTLGRLYELTDYKINVYVTKNDNNEVHYLTNKFIKENFELIDEPQFKQGDKVLVSYNEIDWHETEFVCYYKDYYYTINGRAKNIKPYEDEIKVGDWVKNNKCGYVFKYDNESDSKINLTKITDEVLINKLNEL